MTAAIVQQSLPVPNFRQASGLRKLYRSSAPDNLASHIDSAVLPSSSSASSSAFHSGNFSLSESERFVLYDATLLVDLRSEPEVDEEKSQALIQGAPGGRFERVDGIEAMMNSQSRRQILRPSHIAPSRKFFLEYVQKNWISQDSTEKTVAQGHAEPTGDIYEVINSRGLLGLVEVVLECKEYIALVLKAITIHLERNSDGKVLIHCNVGKDRTGIIVMLCGAMLGLKDDEIVDDFAKSNCIQPLAERRFEEIFQGKVDAVGFSYAPPQTMILTLQYLREKYGSIQNYLDAISFDKTWQDRFVSVAS